MKKLIPAYIMAFVSSFMFFIFEPISMYANNVNDFWFDIYMMMGPTLIIFLISFLGISAIFTIVYFINNKYSEKLHEYKALVVIAFVFLVILYIQGNYLIGNLPPLDGTEIDWGSYTTEHIISIVVITIVTLAVGISTYKFKYDKTIKVYTFISAAIFVMLLASFTTVLLGEETFNKKEDVLLVTNENINKISTDKNFLIFLVDATDSKIFEGILNNSEYKDTFKDFTYYPDTVCAYPFTRDAVPFIFAGIWNENQTTYGEYRQKCFEDSKLLNELKDRNYNMNIYQEGCDHLGKMGQYIDNCKEEIEAIDTLKYLKQILKYDMFKYFPYPLKQFSRIETMDYNTCMKVGNYEVFRENNVKYYNNLIENNELEKINQKYFSYVHIEGGHVPFDHDKDLNPIEGGTYEQKTEGVLHIINEYINRLKANGTYDNSVIIVMSDHGYNFNEYVGRQNPILFIKGINEHHDMITSDKPVSYEDLNEIYMDLLNDKTSEELLPNIDYNRTRRYILYEFTKEDHMMEYEQRGTADNEETLVPTGVEYNR